VTGEMYAGVMSLRTTRSLLAPWPPPRFLYFSCDDFPRPAGIQAQPEGECKRTLSETDGRCGSLCTANAERCSETK
jgi:hypothetical protein